MFSKGGKMNGKLAKQIRREVYMGRVEETKYEMLEDRSIVCTGLRAKYKKFKKEVKREKIT
jgi:hypothetical protein